MSLCGALVGSVVGGLALYFAVGLLVHWFYYHRRRDHAHAWKLQSERWPSARVIRAEVINSALNLAWMSLASGLLVDRIIIANPTQIYFHGHGIAFSIATAVAYFFMTEIALYWNHRLFHQPFLYRRIHRWHHRIGAPTVFSTLATHPVECATHWLVMMAPLFIIPVHVVAAATVVILQNVVALFSHSGVRFPRLPVVKPQFHDAHHLHVSVNYGQMLDWFDRLFGTSSVRDAASASAAPATLPP